MIPVALAPEPPGFDQTVRQPGNRALAKLQREAGSAPVRASALPPLWREVAPDLWKSYGGICAYLCLFIPKATGSRTTDHLLPKSTHLELAYEWSNYRLACGRMNGRKGTEHVLDPFEVKPGWFALDLVDFQVFPSPELSARETRAVQETIDQLELNDSECKEARAEFAQAYWDSDISLRLLERWAPFIALEMRRQGRLIASTASTKKPSPRRAPRAR